MNICTYHWNGIKKSYGELELTLAKSAIKNCYTCRYFHHEDKGADDNLLTGITICKNFEKLGERTEKDSNKDNCGREILMTF